MIPTHFVHLQMQQMRRLRMADAISTLTEVPRCNLIARQIIQYPITHVLNRLMQLLCAEGTNNWLT